MITILNKFIVQNFVSKEIFHSFPQCPVKILIVETLRAMSEFVSSSLLRLVGWQAERARRVAARRNWSMLC